jgi:hypothetical protein
VGVNVHLKRFAYGGSIVGGIAGVVITAHHYGVAEFVVLVPLILLLIYAVGGLTVSLLED